MNNCPKCNAQNPKGAKFCESCGNVLTGQQQETVHNNDFSFCPECGKSIEAEASFCAHCGTTLGKQCNNCHSQNTSDAVFCRTCGEPLSWMCPICNNINQVGALYCESCGSNSVIKKSAQNKIYYFAAVSVIVILLITAVVKWNQLTNDLQNSRQNADNSEFEMAYKHLSDAENNWLPFTRNKTMVTKKYIAEAEERYANEQQKLASAQQNSHTNNRNPNGSSTSNSSLSNVNLNETNIFSVIVENYGFISVEVSKYTVKIQRTADLNGESVYGYSMEETHTSGFFGSDAVFYNATYGYYTVEYYGYDKFDNKVFHKKYSNVLHRCHTVATFYTDSLDPNIYCF